MVEKRDPAENAKNRFTKAGPNMRKIGGDSGRVRHQMTSAGRELMRVYGQPTSETDPGEVLLKEIQRTSGIINWLSDQLGRQNPEEFVHSLWLTKRQSGWISPKEIDQYKAEAAGAIWVDLFLAERKHLASICRTALAAGLEERRVRFAEQMGELIGETIVSVLQELGLDTDDENVRAVIYQHLLNASNIHGQRVLQGKSLPVESEMEEPD